MNARIIASIFGLALAGLAFGSEANAACTPIGTAAQFNNIRTNLAGDYCLTADINAASLGNFVPIGSAGTPFTGRLDGAGFAVFNLNIDDALTQRSGLFRYIDGGTVTNLRLIHVTVKAIRDVGAVVGQLLSGSTVSNVSVTGNVTLTAGPFVIGGIAGSCSGNIVNTSFSGTVSGGITDSDVGGIAGNSLSPCAITGASARGTIVGGGNGGSLPGVGGLVGILSSGTVTGSRAGNKVTAAALSAAPCMSVV